MVDVGGPSISVPFQYWRRSLDDGIADVSDRYNLASASSNGTRLLSFTWSEWSGYRDRTPFRCHAAGELPNSCHSHRELRRFHRRRLIRLRNMRCYLHRNRSGIPEVCAKKKPLIERLPGEGVDNPHRVEGMDSYEKQQARVPAATPSDRNTTGSIQRSNCLESRKFVPT